MRSFYMPDRRRPRVSTPVDLPISPVHRQRKAGAYVPEPGLVDAVNVALTLRQPLIVTGEPGTGKTMLAYSIAETLGLPPPLTFEAKSTSRAQDLFYTYDTLGRFTARELGTAAAEPKDYLTFNALGMAILRSLSSEAVEDVLPNGVIHPGPHRSVVLIDEIEKAPRDFPNDILNEIERNFFRIPELGNRVIEADTAFDPVVIMTNNSEKSLPDAFLRRCIFYHIPFPTGARLIEIVLSQLADIFDETAVLMRDAVMFVIHVRSDVVDLEKKPGTSEVLNWLRAMVAFDAAIDEPLGKQRMVALRASSSLVKIEEDQQKIERALQSWGNG